MMKDTRPNRNNHVVIGVDHGYGNIKTAHACFRAGVTAYDREPFFKNDMITYEGKYYVIGAEHKKFTFDKMTDPDYFILTLAAIGMELEQARMTFADVHLAVGLPLTWYTEQRDTFRAYLMQKREIEFTFHDQRYHIRLTGVEVFPQGFAAVAPYIVDLEGITMICDIGNGTMNIMKLSHGTLNQKTCFTEKYGTNQCMILIREQLLRKFGTAVDEDIIEGVLRTGEGDISEKYLTVIRETATAYAAEIMNRLREHEYNPDLMRLHIVGGGGCILQDFGKFDKSRVTINTDICANAKGYEYLAESRLKKAGIL